MWTVVEEAAAAMRFAENIPLLSYFKKTKTYFACRIQFYLSMVGGCSYCCYYYKRLSGSGTAWAGISACRVQVHNLRPSIFQLCSLYMMPRLNSSIHRGFIFEPWRNNNTKAGAWRYLDGSGDVRPGGAGRSWSSFGPARFRVSIGAVLPCTVRSARSP